MTARLPLVYNGSGQIEQLQSGDTLSGGSYPQSVWASLPAANSVAAGTVYQVTDVGVGGSFWASDGTNWNPMTDILLARITVPTGIASSATISTGSSGHLTVSEAFKTTYSNGVWLYFGAVSSTPALAAGLYYCVMSSTTVGTIYQSGPGSSAYNFSSGASYGGDGSANPTYTALSTTLPANVLGTNRGVDIECAWAQNLSAGSALIGAKLGSSSNFFLASDNYTSTWINYYRLSLFRNNGNAKTQWVNPAGYIAGTGAGYSTIDTTAAQTLSVLGGVTTSGTTNQVFEFCELYLH
jgi:hypothetical protein